jgi:hypothetical protein
MIFLDRDYLQSSQKQPSIEMVICHGIIGTGAIRKFNHIQFIVVLLFYQEKDNIV